MSRFCVTRVVISLAIVLATYSAYAFLAVPYIEPEVGRRPNQPSVATEDIAIHDPVSDPLRHLFALNAWELQDTAKSLESARATVKFKEYRMVDDGSRMELTPCTIILHSDRVPNPGSRNGHRYVVLSAPHGAVLQFDGPVNLRTASTDRLVGGQLRGLLVIYGPESYFGAGDDLRIETQNISISRDRIWTPHEVRFRYGANMGRGRDLEILLLPKKDSDNAGRSLANLGGLRSLKLTQVERFNLELPGDNRPVATQATVAKSGHRMSEQFEITCRGPFRYDFEKNVASFIDQVDVVHLNPNGISDQLNCQKLDVQFGDGKSPGVEGATVSPSEGERDSKGLEPQLLRAWGHPVIARSPSSGIEVRSQRLEYDLLRRRILLSGSEPVTLCSASQLVTTPKLEYELDASGGVGRLWAAGPGKMETMNQANATDHFIATWRKEVRLQPQNECQVLSLMGGAHLRIAGTGDISAKEIHCWLVDHDVSEKGTVAELATLSMKTGTAADRKAPSLVPQRLKAVHDVVIRSPRLVGETQVLEVWLTDVAREMKEAIPHKHLEPRRSNVKTDLESGMSNTSTTGTDPQNVPQHQLRLRGNLIQLEVVQAADGPVVRNVTVGGNAFVSNSATGDSRGQHLTVSGKTLDIRNAETQRADIQVEGSPAQVRFGTLALSSDHIHFDQRNHRIQMNGPGWMTAPIDRDLEGRPLSRPQDLFVAWRGQMAFDGVQIHFEDSIDVRTKHLANSAGKVTVNDSRIVSDMLDVTLANPIDFFAAKMDQSVDVRKIEFQGNVHATNRSQENGKLASIDEMVVITLSIDQRTGDLLASGPGQVNSVRYGAARLPSMSHQSTPARRPPAGNTTLTYLNVEFQKSLAGSRRQKQLHFTDGVRATYGPIDNWTEKLDADIPQCLGPDGIVMTCQRLSLYDMRCAADMSDAIELFATGNTVVEGSSFTARAQRITYASAKDVLVMEGEGRSDAELFVRQRGGKQAHHIPAKKIVYWLETGNWKVGSLGPPTIYGF